MAYTDCDEPADLWLIADALTHMADHDMVIGYRVNYRRVLEIQARLLARVLTGELSTYPVFTTR